MACMLDRVGDAAMEQALVYEKLPRDIADRHVLLLDPMLGCGSSAVKAIEVRWRVTHLQTLLHCIYVQANAARNAPSRHNTCPHAPQVLLGKGVEEGKILFLTLIAAPEGLTNICRRYPKVRQCCNCDCLEPSGVSCAMC